MYLTRPFYLLNEYRKKSKFYEGVRPLTLHIYMYEWMCMYMCKLLNGCVHACVLCIYTSVWKRKVTTSLRMLLFVRSFDVSYWQYIGCRERMWVQRYCSKNAKLFSGVSWLELRRLACWKLYTLINFFIVKEDFLYISVKFIVLYNCVKPTHFNLWKIP